MWRSSFEGRYGMSVKPLTGPAFVYGFIVYFELKGNSDRK